MTKIYSNNQLEFSFDQDKTPRNKQPEQEFQKILVKNRFVLLSEQYHAIQSTPVKMNEKEFRGFKPMIFDAAIKLRDSFDGTLTTGLRGDFDWLWHGYKISLKSQKQFCFSKQLNSGQYTRGESIQLVNTHGNTEQTLPEAPIWDYLILTFSDKSGHPIICCWDYAYVKNHTERTSDQFRFYPGLIDHCLCILEPSEIEMQFFKEQFDKKLPIEVLNEQFTMNFNTVIHDLLHSR